MSIIDKINSIGGVQGPDIQNKTDSQEYAAYFQQPSGYSGGLQQYTGFDSISISKLALGLFEHDRNAAGLEIAPLHITSVMEVIKQLAEESVRPDFNAELPAKAATLKKTLEENHTESAAQDENKAASLGKDSLQEANVKA